MKIKECKPLVSVIVITYNSSLTVLDTLESIKKQTYRNIELIVTDDCSTDDTCSIVACWLENNKNTFKRAVLIKTLKNGGPAVNCNHGIKNALGEWSKVIAADDILLPDCIKQNVDYVNNHGEIQILFSKVNYFSELDNSAFSQDGVNWNFWKLTARQQHYLILLDNWITAPSQFIRKDVWEYLGGFDESIPFIEDWPFWIKAYNAGVKFGFLDEPTVKYRIHESLSSTCSPSPLFSESLKLAYKYAHRCQYNVSPLLRFYSFVRDDVKFNVIKKILFAMNPYYWYIKHVNSLVNI